MDNFIMETERLMFRELNPSDYIELCKFLQDIEVMYAWEHAFSDKQVREWLDKNILRYKNEGFGYWAVINKGNNKLIGNAGLLSTLIDGEKRVEVGYIFNKEFWHKGFAYESAKACVDYAFNKLNLSEIYASIRPTNLSSIKVAEKLGMKLQKEFIKLFENKEMLHLLYFLKKRPKKIKNVLFRKN